MYQPYMPFQQYQPPIQQPMAQQTFQPSIPTQPNMAGRIVKTVEEIVPNEVPMNGNVGIFPLSDMSSIYVKGWNQDGTISTVLYRPVSNEEKPQEASISLMDIMDSLNDIQDLLKAEKPATTKRSTTRKKAEDDASD